jgi:hypothetical protein
MEQKIVFDHERAVDSCAASYFVLRFLLVPFVADDTDLVSSAICMQLIRSR